MLAICIAMYDQRLRIIEKALGHKTVASTEWPDPRKIDN